MDMDTIYLAVLSQFILIEKIGQPLTQPRRGDTFFQGSEIFLEFSLDQGDEAADIPDSHH